MSMSYVWEKFHNAVLTLATSDAPLRERLISAFTFSLILLDREKMPPDLEKRYDALCNQVTATKAIGNEGNIAASVNQLEPEEIKHLAEEIVSMYGEVNREVERLGPNAHKITPMRS